MVTPNPISRRTLLHSAAGLAALALAGCSGDRETVERRVLFIGNSFTAYNGGVPAALGSLAPRFTCGSNTKGGRYLAEAATDRAVLSEIGKGWDAVVLQEQSVNAVLDYPAWIAAAKVLRSEAAAAGAATYLYMTWRRADVPAMTLKRLKRAYSNAATEVPAKVVPVALAFEASEAERPSLQLRVHDGHPTKAGTYLAACTFFARLAGKSPVGNSFHGSLPEADAAFLQRMAAGVSWDGSGG